MAEHPVHQTMQIMIAHQVGVEAHQIFVFSRMMFIIESLLPAVVVDLLLISISQREVLEEEKQANRALRAVI